MSKGDYLKGSEVIPELLMNGQKVELKNPGTDYFVDFLKISRDIAKVGEDAKSEEIMSGLSDDSLEALQNLVNGTLQVSFKDMWKNDREELKAWGMKNGMTIMMKVMEMCVPEQNNIEQKKKEIIRKRLNEHSTGTKE